MKQGSTAGTGYLWVLAPAGSAGWFYLINVYLSEANGTEQHACTGGDASPDSAMYVSSQWADGGACTFLMEYNP